jgi:hypothetical protein
MNLNSGLLHSFGAIVTLACSHQVCYMVLLKFSQVSFHIGISRLHLQNGGVLQSFHLLQTQVLSRTASMIKNRRFLNSIKLGALATLGFDIIGFFFFSSPYQYPCTFGSEFGPFQK